MLVGQQSPVGALTFGQLAERVLECVSRSLNGAAQMFGECGYCLARPQQFGQSDPRIGLRLDQRVDEGKEQVFAGCRVLTHVRRTKDRTTQKLGAGDTLRLHQPRQQPGFHQR